MNKIKDMLQLLKIKHYIKNLVIFLPVIFEKKLNDLHSLEQILVAFAAFCLMSSIIYIFNDIRDIEKDRLHPIKSQRPIASGKISIAVIKKTLVILFLLVGGLSLFLNMPCNLCLWGYFLLNICYSLTLKNIKFIDMICIALGFVLRILTGFYVFMLPVSFSICLMILMASIFFTSSKRLLEFNLALSVEKYRSIARYTNPFMLRSLMYGSAFCSLVAYIFAVITYSKYISYLYLTIICFGLFIGRLLYLVNKPQNHDDPMNFIEKDKTIKIISIVSLIFLAILYMM